MLEEVSHRVWMGQRDTERAGGLQLREERVGGAGMWGGWSWVWGRRRRGEGSPGLSRKIDEPGVGGAGGRRDSAGFGKGVEEGQAGGFI